MLQVIEKSESFPSGVVRTTTPDGKFRWTFADGTETRKSPVDGWPERVSKAGGMIIREFPDGAGNYAMFFRHDRPEQIAREFEVMRKLGPAESAKVPGTTAASVLRLATTKQDAPPAKALPPSRPEKTEKVPVPPQQAATPQKSNSPALQNKVTEQVEWVVYGSFKKAGRAVGVFTLLGIVKKSEFDEMFEPSDFDFCETGTKKEVNDKDMINALVRGCVKKMIRAGKLEGIDWTLDELMVKWP